MLQSGPVGTIKKTLGKVMVDLEFASVILKGRGREELTRT